MKKLLLIVSVCFSFIACNNSTCEVKDSAIDTTIVETIDSTIIDTTVVDTIIVDSTTNL